MQFTVDGRGNFQYCPRCRPNHRKSSKYQPDPKRICKGCRQPFWSKGKREYCVVCHPPKTIKICLNCHHSFTSLGGSKYCNRPQCQAAKSKHGPGVGRQKMSDRHYFHVLVPEETGIPHFYWQHVGSNCCIDHGKRRCLSLKGTPIYQSDGEI